MYLKTIGGFCYLPCEGGNPGIILILWGFVAFSTGCLMMCLALSFALMFYFPVKLCDVYNCSAIFSDLNSSLIQGGTGLYASHAFVCLLYIRNLLSFSLPLGGMGLMCLLFVPRLDFHLNVCLTDCILRIMEVHISVITLNVLFTCRQSAFEVKSIFVSETTVILCRGKGKWYILFISHTIPYSLKAE